MLGIRRQGQLPSLQTAKRLRDGRSSPKPFLVADFGDVQVVVPVALPCDEKLAGVRGQGEGLRAGFHRRELVAERVAVVSGRLEVQGVVAVAAPREKQAAA